MARIETFEQVLLLLHESEQELATASWSVNDSDRDVINPLVEALDSLARRHAEQRVSDLAEIHDTIAELAVYATRTSGRLAWMLAETGRALEPVVLVHLLPAPAVASDGLGLDEAEHVLLRLRTVLHLARAPESDHT